MRHHGRQRAGRGRRALALIELLAEVLEHVSGERASKLSHLRRDHAADGEYDQECQEDNTDDR